jgi:AcrR family transcriptional regulator
MSKPIHSSPDPPPPSRLAILDAAEVEFSERGFDGVRIEHVARRAGYNKSLVYRYFGNREGLYAAVLERAASRRTETGRPLPRSVAALLLQISREIEADPRGARLLLGGTTAPSAATKEMGVDAPHHDEIAALVRVLQGSGELEPEFDSGMFYLTLLGMASVPLLLPHVVRQVTGLPADSSEFRERWEDTLVWLADSLAG